MQISFSYRGITLTDSMRKKAERGVLKVAERVPRATRAKVRFAERGVDRHVEIVFSAPRGLHLVASTTGRHWGPAIDASLAKLRRQAATERRLASSRVTAKRATSRRIVARVSRPD